jgi:hypothetical protein
LVKSVYFSTLSHDPLFCLQVWLNFGCHI